MSYLAVFKRIIPFFLTFVGGLLIASIFVPITAPSFPRAEERQGRWRHNRECKRERESLRRENLRLRQELEQVYRNAADAEFRNLKLSVPEVTVDVPPVPPPPPSRVR